MFGLPRWKIISFIPLVFMIWGMAQGCIGLTSNMGQGFGYFPTISLSLVLMGMGLSIILWISFLLEDKVNNGTIYFMAMILTNCIGLFGNFIASYFEGDVRYIFSLDLSNNAIYAANVMTLAEFWLYLTYVLNVRSKLVDNVEKIVFGALAVVMILLFVNIFTGSFFVINSYGYFVSGDYYFILYIVLLFTLAFMIYPIYRLVSDKRKKIALYSYIFFPIVGGVADFLIHDIGLTSLFILFALLIIYGNFYVGRSHDLVKKDAELVQQRAEVLVSQIRPHFLYNSLTSIMNIKGTPMETREAIIDFAKYMRGNLDTLTQKSAIPIMKEIEHVENYVLLNKLEKTGLELNLDLKDRNFLIPALTLQVLVENSILHGFEGRNDGMITISTEETETAHVVNVVDNGSGFDRASYHADKNDHHLGLNMIYARLKDMVGGSVDIESTPGKGTVVKVIIPKPEARKTSILPRLK